MNLPASSALSFMSCSARNLISSIRPARGRRQEQREPRQRRRKHTGEREHRHQQAARPDAARRQRGHLAVAVQTREREHHAKKQCDRREQRREAQ